MNFGEAIEALKEGKRVTRPGWNGKGMFIFLGRPDPRGYAPRDEWCETGPGEPCIWMWTAQRTWQPGWLASQADMLAEDWEIKP